MHCFIVESFEDDENSDGRAFFSVVMENLA